MSAESQRRRGWIYWLPALVVMAVIFALSSQSGLRVSEDPVVDRPIRASAHMFAFATLAACLLFALARGGRPRLRDVVIAFALTVLYGFSDELHQWFVPDRNGRIDDVIVDTIGAVVGLAIAWFGLAWRARLGASERELGERDLPGW